MDYYVSEHHWIVIKSLTGKCIQIADVGYKTPGIAKLLIDDGIKPFIPYKRPREPYMEMCEDIRQTPGMKDLYSLRKETIERIFGTAKENHGFRHTRMFGKTACFWHALY